MGLGSGPLFVPPPPPPPLLSLGNHLADFTQAKTGKKCPFPLPLLLRFLTPP